jgi:NACHT domain
MSSRQRQRAGAGSQQIQVAGDLVILEGVGKKNVAESEIVHITEQLASVMEQSVLDAAAGVLVRSPVTSWPKLVERFKGNPNSFRSDVRWDDARLTAQRAGAAVNYLQSPMCQGLLQILVYVYIRDSGREAALQASALGDAFTKELVSRLDEEGLAAEAFSRQLWRVAANALARCAKEIKQSEFVIEAQSLAASLLSMRVQIVEPTRQRSQKQPSQSHVPSIAAVVPERAALADEYERSQSVLVLVDQIRQSTADLYSKLAMPHAREQYSVDIDKIYVPRKLQSVSVSELTKHQASILMPEVNRTSFRQSNLRAVPLTLDWLRTDLTTRSNVPEDAVMDHRFVVIGNPGAGKTTFVRYLLYSSSRDTARCSFIYELKKYPFDDPKSFHELIARNIQAMNHVEVDRSMIRDIFVMGLGLVIFDGLDEVTDMNQRRQITETIEAFARAFPLVRIVVTSREEGYSAARLRQDLFSVYRLPDFTEDQVIDYVNRWFSLTTDPGGGDSAAFLSSRFMEESEHAADLRTNPLMLSLLCMIYRYEGYIPENRPQVYEECAELLFDRWDKVRHIRSHIRPDAKGRYLVQELAYFFYTHQRSQGGAEEFVLLRVLQDYLARNIIDNQDEARERARDFLDYCAGRAWLLARVGTSRRGERLFGFTHRTFMEYFAGCYFVRNNPGIGQFVDKMRLLVDSGGSEIIPQIAIQRFDEGTAGGLDDSLSMLLFESRTLTEKIRTSYLPFVLRCLRFMAPTPHTLDKIFTAACRYYSMSRSPEILSLLTSMNRDCRAVLTQFCERVVEDSRSGMRGDSLPLIFACYMILTRVNDEKSKQLRSSLEASLLANLEEVSKWGYVDFISELLSRGLVDPGQFSRLCGAQNMLVMEVLAAGKKVLIPGIATLEIVHASECDRHSIRFYPTPAFRWLFSDPSSLPSLSRRCATLFLSHLDAGGVAFAGFSVTLHKLASRRLVRGAAVFAMMVAIELDDLDCPQWVNDVALRATGSGFFARLKAARAQRETLDKSGVNQLGRLGLDSSWTDFVISWTKSDFSVIDQ